MAIYRGPGGPGDAIADADSEAALVSTLVTQAQTAATNASNSATASSNSATTAQGHAANAAVSASAASSSASNASTSESNALTSANNAASSASAASTSDSNAAASASAAASSATSASNSASSASTSATNAASSASAAAASYDSFDDRYLGAKSTEPTLDNDGDALITGALYFNSVDGKMYVWDGSEWDELAGAGGGSGTVTSVDMTVPTGLSVAGSPVTTSGTLAVTYSSGYAIPTTTKQTEWDTAYGWGNHASAGYLTSETYTGTVTSVAMTVPTGLTVSGTPITSSGTFAVSLQSGYAIPTTIKQSNWDDSYTFVSNFPTQSGNTGKYLTTDGSALSWATVSYTETDPVFVASPAYGITNTDITEWDSAYTDRLKWDGGSTGLTASTGRTSLGATTLGSNLFTITNPSAITFPRFNADNTVSSLSASDFRTAIGAGTGNGTVTSVGGTGTVNGITLTGTVTSSGSLTLGGALSGVNLTTQVTGTLPVANGGTGGTTFTANNVLLGNGTSAFQSVAPGTNGNVLTSNGTTWTSAPATGGGITTGKAIAMAIVFG